MDLSITLIEGGWVVMVDNGSNMANLCIPVRPNEITLSFITVEQWTTYEEAKERAIAFSVMGITPEIYLRMEGDDNDAEDQAAEVRPQIPAAAAAT